MNKNRHRIIFNAARGQRMVVQETAASTGRGRQAASGTATLSAVTGAAQCPWVLSKLLACLAWAVWLPVGQAQIVADPAAPRGQRPQVLVAPNGVPLVNIATPSAGGVSINNYNRFDVNRQGAILNNSRGNTATQLGGWVQGNPWLATGSARIIVNQVNSSNPSHLNGYVEVAGQRAEVVIANPSGISVDGGGFINASRVTLTTGTPQYGMGGSLDGYVVRGGTVRVGGAGLDLSTTDYAAILARAVQVNAAIHANDLKVVTGANQISADHSQIAGASGNGPVPAYALDVSALGGMYSGHIVLVGTEAGLGVRNAGTIGAGSGGLVVTAAGRLENTGVLQSAADASLQAAALANTGRIAATQTLSVRTAGDLANTAGGTLAAQSLQLDAGGTLDNRGGTLRQSSGAGLALAAPTLSNTAGGWIGSEPVSAGGSSGSSGGGSGNSGASGTGSGSSGNAGGGSSTATAGNAPAPSPAPSYVAPDGHLRAGGALLNDGGQVYAGGPLTLQTQNLVNTGGTVSVARMALSQPQFQNQGGTLNVTGAFAAAVDRFDNTGGTVRAGSLDVRSTGDVVNEGGMLASDGDAQLSAGGQLRNGQGTVSAVGALDVQAGTTIDNRGGTLQANQAVGVRAASLANEGGRILSTGGAASLGITGALANGAGAIGAATDLYLQAGSVSNAAGGSLRAGQDLDLQATGAVTNAGLLSAGGTATINAGSLQSTGLLAAGVKADGTLDTQGDLHVTTTGALVAQGSNLAAGQMALQGASVDLSGSQTQGASVTVKATAGDADARRATVSSPGALAVQATGAIANDAGTLSANAIALNAATLTNTQGGRIVQTGTGDTTLRASTSLDNSAGLIASNGQNLQLQGGAIRNEGGSIQHAGTGTLTLFGLSLMGNGGQIVSNGDLAAQVQGDWQQAGGSTSAQNIALQAGGAVDNGVLGASGGNSASGQLIAAKDATLTVGSLANGGTLRAGQALNVTATGAVSSSGQISAGGAATVTAGSLQSTGLLAAGLKDDGTLDTQGALRVTTTGALAAQGHNLAAGQMALQGASVDLSGSQTHAASVGIKATAGDASTQRATVSTPGQLTVQAAGRIANDAGTLSADTMALDAASITNTQSGRILQTGTGDTTIRASTTLDNSAGLIASNGQNLQLQGGAIRNEGGSIQHAGAGTLTVTGSSMAGNGGQIVGNGDLAAQVQGDWQQAGGSTFAQNIALQAGGAVDNGVPGASGNSGARGQLIAAKDATLTVGSLANGGTLRAGQALNVTATGAVANSGQLSAGGGVTIDAGSLQSTGLLAAGLKADGTLDTQGDLRITTTGALVVQGSNLAAGHMALQGASVDLGGSQTQAAAIGVKATAGDASTRGATVSTPGALDVQATGAIANDAGTLSADAIALDAATLTNTQGGRILQTGTSDTTIRASTTLDNSAGLIASNGQNLQLQGGAIRNEAGRIQHAGTGTLSLRGDSLQGAGGQIVGNGALVGQMQGAWNQAGGSSLAERVTLGAASLDNSAGGQIVQSGTGAMQLSVAGAADNAGGRITGNGAITAAAASLDNRRGTVQAANGGDLGVTVQGALDNSAGGQLLAGNDAQITAGALTNDTGRIAAVGTLDAAVVGAANNQGGSVTANGAVQLAAASWNNAGGTAGSSQSSLALSTAQGIDNTAGGRLQAATGLSLATQGGALDNRTGRVLGDTVAIDTRGGSLDNREGVIGATDTLRIDSGALANDAGLIQSGGALAIDTHGQTLSNTNAAGQGSQRQGKDNGIVSVGTLTLTTGALDNSQGFLAAKGTLKATTSGQSSNTGGTVFSQSDIAIDTQSATYDNHGGSTQAQGDLRIAGAAVLNHDGGLIRASGTTTLTAARIDNSRTRGSDQGIEGQNVAITATDFYNSQGSVRANDSVGATLASGLDNRDGLMSAGGALSLTDSKAANPAAKTLAVTNTGGTLEAGSSLGLNAARFSGDGLLSSQGDLAIDLTQSLTNNAVLRSNGKLRYATTGDLTNNGQLIAGTDLEVAGNQVTNSAGAEMSGQNTQVTAGALTNRGLIDSQGHTRIDAGSVDNVGTGRIYGNHVSIGAGSVTNREENGTSATIAARQRLDIGATTVTNREHALVFSGGDMAIAGGLDANGYAIGQGDTLYNHSAQIEALGNMRISMRTVDNRDVHVHLGPPQTGVTIDSYLAPKNNAVTLIPTTTPCRASSRYDCVQINSTTTRDTATGFDPASIRAGGDMLLAAGVTNANSIITAGGTLQAASVTQERLQGNQQITRRTIKWSASKQLVDVTVPEAPTSIDVGGIQYQGGLNGTQQRALASAPTGQTANGGTGSATGAAGSGGRAVVVEVPAQVSAPADSASTSAGSAQGSQPTPQAASTADPGSANAVQAASVADRTARQFAGGKAGDAAGDAATAQAAAGSTASVSMVIRTTTPALALPQASLFSLTPGTASRYLVETDPRFANYRQWLSSDYLLNALGLDPAATQKRLGDGYYERMLVNQQVQQLTGHARLAGYASDDAQYTALMNAGASFARQFNLRPGVALSAEQMAQLTSDIVWLVEQSVTLPDGTTQKVLVPQVYVRVRPGDIDGSGAVLSAERLYVTDPNASFTNGGTVAGRQLVSIDSRSIDVLNGRISGGDVTLKAKEDISVVGSTVDATKSLAVQAGRDVNVVTTTRTATGAQSTTHVVDSQDTRVDRVAGLYVSSPSGTLMVSAGRDLNLAGAQVVNAGTGATTLSAVRDVNLATVQVGSRFESTGEKDSLSASQASEVGTSISNGGGLLAIRAGQDLNARQASVNAGQGLALLSAGRDMVIAAGESSSSMSVSKESTRKNLFTSSTTRKQTDTSSSTSVGSSIQGGLVWLDARRDLLLEAAKIDGTQGVGLTAGRDLAIVEGRDTTTVRQDTQTNKTLGGLLAPGNASIKKTGTTVEVTTDTTNASRITSGQGGITIQAGSTAFLQGAQVDAAKDVNIRGGNVIVQAAQDTTSVTGSHTTKSSLLDLGTYVLRDVGKGLKAKESGQTEQTRTDLARSSISGANVTVEAAGTAALSATDVSTPGTLTLKGENVVLGTQASQTGTHTTSQGRDLVYQVARDSGKVDQTTQYNRLNVGQLDVQAQNIQVGVGVRDSIEQLAKQPGMAWMGQLVNDPRIKDRIDWRQVEEVHKRWKDDHQGLTKEGGIIVTVVVTWLTWGAASGAGAAASEATASAGVAAMGEGGFIAAGGMTVSSVVGGAVAAGVSALASQAARSLINNQFDLGKTLKDLGSSSSVHSLVTAILTGGALAGLNMNPTGMPTAGSGAQGFATQLGQNLQAGAIRAVIDTAVNGGSLQDRLKSNLITAVIDTAAAQGANAIGNLTQAGTLNSFGNKVAHAIAGCIGGIAKADSASGCGAGALGAALGELAAETYGRRADTVQFAGMISALGAALAGGDAEQIGIAQWMGANVAANNYLKHPERVELGRSLAACYATGDQAACETALALQMKDGLSDRLLANAVASCSGADCNEVSQFIQQQMSSLGCQAPSACPDYGTLSDFWRVAQAKAQGLTPVYPESWLLDAKALLDLGKLGARALSSIGPGATSSLDALNQVLRTDPQELARFQNGFLRDDWQQFDHFRSTTSMRPGGAWDWQRQAPNDGAIPGTQQTELVSPGTTLDRYGYRGGEYMSPAGTPYAQRALPPGKIADPYEQYEVLRPFTVDSERIAPAFGQPGQGIQMRAKIPEVQDGYAKINDLIKHGYLKDPKK